MNWSEKGFWLLWGFKINLKLKKELGLIKNQGHPEHSAAVKNRTKKLLKDETRELLKSGAIKSPKIFFNGHWIEIDGL